MRILLFGFLMVCSTCIETSNTQFQPISIVPNSNITCLAENIYHEARGEPVRGMYAVAFVTLTRAKSLANVCKVVYKSSISKSKKICQFSWVCQNNKTIRDQKSWKRAKAIAKRVATGKLKDFTWAADHYHATSVNPFWADASKITAQIGNHIFYKLSTSSYHS